MAIMRHSFIFGGVNSADYGIYIGGEGTYNAPKRAVESVSIPGRNGDLLIDQGRYENIEVTYSGFNYETDLETFAMQLGRFRNAIMSLKGYQKLTDSFHPEEYRLAAYMDDFEIKPIMYNTAAKFDIVFNCKPQRFLTAGEDPVTVTTSGASVYNPTLFESQPLLGVEGYGNIYFNNYDIEITNETLGKTELYPMRRGSASSPGVSEVTKQRSVNMELVNSGDTVTLGTATIPAIKVTDRIAVVPSATISGRHKEDSGASGETGAEITSYDMNVWLSIDPFDIVIGTASSVTRSSTISLYCNHGGTSKTVTYTIAASIAYNGNSTVSYTVDRMITSNPDNVAYVGQPLIFDCGPASAMSSVSVLGHPTYIDCELGEAYQIKNGEMISLNKYIDLGSDIPTFAPGANTITFDNTITSIEIKPRWWRI